MVKGFMGKFGGVRHRPPTIKNGVPVYTGGADKDRLSIMKQVRDLPEQQKSRTGEIILSKYERLFHSMYDATFITDMNGNILEVNARAEYNFIWAKEDLCAMNVIDLISGADEELLTAIRDSISTDKYLVVDAICVRSDETRFDAEIMINSISGLDRDMLCFFFRDVTTRKNAQVELAQANEKLLESEKIRARLDTVSTLVHDLNNPLQILTVIGDSDGNKEIQTQVARIVDVLQRLHSEEALRTVVDEKGETRYDLPTPEPQLTDCDYNRFLVVDDEMMLRQTFVESLALAFPNAQVEAAADGQQAIDLFVRRRYGLIVMDLVMPVMSGEEAYDEIATVCQREGWKIPSFIFCAGFVPSDRVKAIVGDGSVHSCMKKPFTTGDLTRSVRETLQRLGDMDI